MKLTIVFYRARDHFTTNSLEENECIQEGIGILVSESKHYMKLKILDSDVNMENSEKEYNNILLAGLTYRKDFPIEVNL